VLLSLVCLLAFQPFTAHAQPLVLEKTGTFTQDTVLGDPAKEVIIPDGAVYTIAGGTVLTIKAHRLRVEGSVTFNGRGEDGAPGADALPRDDTWNSSGTHDPHWEYTAAGTEADQGLPGANGEDGKPGATIHIKAGTIADKELAEKRLHANLHVEGGQGGAGGTGGAGRPLQCGEHAYESKLGPPGFPGLKGAPGTSGQLTIQGVAIPAPRQIALTVSGGISLGSYEAGYNWGLLRHVKARASEKWVPGAPPALEIIGVAGASAGAINTLLTAMSYCQTDAADKEETPAQNLFTEAWLPIGFPALLPPPGEPGVYGQEDALLSRKEFSVIEQKLAAKLRETARYKQDCRLPIGVTVTRREPEQLSGGGIEAPVDRFSVALEARSTAAGLEFYDIQKNYESDYVKPYLHFTPTPENPISAENVLAALRASSSFPFAFGMQPLTYYTSAGAEPKTEMFWDGGLYDNMPIGLALSFIEQPPNGLPQKTSGGVQLLAINPDARRIPRLAATGPGKASEQPLGLKNLERIAGNLLSVASKYEMQNFIRFAIPRISAGCGSQVAGRKAPCIEETLVSSRFSPVFGERIGAFGAFVLQGFRQFDFAVGIYDAAHSLVDRQCKVERASLQSAERRTPYSASECMVRGMHQRWEEVGAEKDAGTNFIFKALLQEEMQQHFGKEETQRALEAVQVSGKSAATWVKEGGAPPRYILVLWADIRREMGVTQKADMFKEAEMLGMLVEDLAKPGDVFKSLPEEDQAVVRQSSLWLRGTFSRLAVRAQVIERKDQYLPGRWVTGGLSFLLGTERSLGGLGWDPDPSSIPDGSPNLAQGALHLVPFHLGIGQRALQAGWRPTFGINKKIALAFPLAASYRFDDEAPYRLGAHAGVSLITRIDPLEESLFLNGFEMGYRVTAGTGLGDSRRPPFYTSATGVEVAVYLLGGKLRIGFATDDVSRFMTTPVVVTFGLADLNGMLFHTFSDPTLQR
jgi:hypothetical protein